MVQAPVPLQACLQLFWQVGMRQCPWPEHSMVQSSVQSLS